MLKILIEAAAAADLGTHTRDAAQVLDILLIGTRRMRALNSRHLGHDWVTDVLAFDLREEPHFSSPEDMRNPIVFGEIYACPQVARERCTEYNTNVGYELVLYVVHGMLHLAGERDKTALQQRRMRQREHEIMQLLESRYTLSSVFKEG